MARTGPFGRRVMEDRPAVSGASWTRTRQARPSSASMVAASDQANCSPMHILGPAPKGRYAPRGWPGALGSKRLRLSGRPTQPAVGLEAFGLGPPPRVAMQQGRADQAHRPDRHRAPTEEHRLEDSSAEHPRRRPQPQRLGEHGHGQGQRVRPVACRGCRRLGIPLGLELGAYRRLMIYRGEGPGEGRGGRLVPGQQQRHHLVPDLPVGQFRLGRQQVQHRGGRRRVSPTPADEVVHGVLEFGPG